jgi:hypothetical protein
VRGRGFHRVRQQRSARRGRRIAGHAEERAGTGVDLLTGRDPSRRSRHPLTLASVTILRELWRFRISVCAAAITAVAVGWLLAFGVSLPPKSRSYKVGVATASVLVDTPRSQVVEVAPEGSETLGERANVLANLMVDGEIKDVIARRAGLPPKQLVATAGAGGAASTAEPATPLNARSHALTTSAVVASDSADLPIIRVQTQAPDVSQAIKLANAAVTGLSSYLDAKAASETVPAARRLRVRPLGVAQGHEAARGPGRITAVGVVILLFLAGCGVILALSALTRGWRAAIASEREEQAAWSETHGGFGGSRDDPDRPTADLRA